MIRVGNATRLINGNGLRSSRGTGLRATTGLDASTHVCMQLTKARRTSRLSSGHAGHPRYRRHGQRDRLDVPPTTNAAAVERWRCRSAQPRIVPRESTGEATRRADSPFRTGTITNDLTLPGST